ncbi:MAG: DNA primase [Chromatiaceae bacterium]|nr:DNA primase [Chromatiaceae bacterium]
MAGRIPPDFIDDLLARTDIVEVIGARLPLRRAGKEYQARCPFHDEKTPSFTVSPEKQFYHCFGCGAHGSAISFLMEFDRLGFREAVEELAHRAGLEVPGGDQASVQGPDLAPLLSLLDAAAALYRRQLREHPAAGRAIEYLKGRGLSGEIAARYGIGFAPPGGDFLLRQLGTSPERRRQLLDCGLTAEREGRHYDRLRDRITFPIRDRRGRVIGFGGRLLGEGKPKYLNSPETPLFHKGRELYGLFEAQQAQRTLERVLVVEGYLDVIALAQFGLTSAVATLGTATTPEHLQRLARLAPELVFCFDGDRAGREAAWKALETALPLMTGRQSVRFLFLPQDADPDSLIRAEGVAGFEARLSDAPPLSRFFFDHLSLGLDLNTLEGRARLLTLAEPLMARVPEGAYRSLLEQHLAELARLEPRRAARRSGARAPRPLVSPEAARPSLIAQAIALLIDQPQLVERIAEAPDDWRLASSPGVAVLESLLEMIRAYPTITKSALLERWRDHPHFHYLQRLSVAPFLRDVPENGAAEDFIGALRRLGTEARKEALSRALTQSSVTQWNEEIRDHIERTMRRS